MTTIHNDPEPWLAAAVHEQLLQEENAAFQEHIAGCATCRSLYEEEKVMSNMIENTLSAARPDLAFEQRIVSAFRKSVPARAGFTAFLSNVWRNRATQLAGFAALLLTLVSVGNWLTSGSRYLGNEELAAPPHGSLAEVQMRNALGDAFVDSARREMSRNETRNKFRGDRSGIAGGKGQPEFSRASPDARASSASAAPSLATAGAPPPPAPAESDPQESQSFAAADSAAPEPPQGGGRAEEDRVIVTGSNITTAEEVGPNAEGPEELVAPDAKRKLIRNAEVELEVIKFDDAVQKISAFAAEDRGYVATNSSQKQANGKLRGEVVVKVLPENLDRFLSRLRGLGELRNQTLGTEDVTKQYFDTDSRLMNARVMEQRLIDILKTKSNKVADLLEVEKELGRVRQQIEEMQGALKYMDAQVQFATVTITLAEKDLDEPAAFLLKRRAQLALFSTDVEKTFAEAKNIVDGAKAQISSSTLDRDSTGEATARLVLLIVPEEADALIERIKGMGRVQNYNEQTERVAQGGSGMSDIAKVERDKVELSITISRNEQEPALQTTSLRILTSAVTDKVARLKENAAKVDAEIRSSSFSRDPDGQEIANITLRVAMKDYPALLGSFDQLGKVKDVSVQREDLRGIVNEETAPADVSVQIYSQPNIVSSETGLFATIRRTLAQGASALMWSLRMIGVALAFLAPWVLAIAVLVWVLRRVSRRRAAKADRAE